ncbi:hypothetical protein KR222_008873 [Zaprionus bogoriensis]|nr:hypothetical protein KR222_008873 [Zaprionus bogoriensis]
MLGTRKELDEHVHKMLAKLPPGRERDVKGWVVGRMYFKINEYAKAIEYLNAYLKFNEEPAAYKLIANCYKLNKTPDYRRALENYQRSIQLNPKQPDVITEACQLLVKHKTLYTHEWADYWLELAESSQDLYDNEVIFELRSIKSAGKVPVIGGLGDKENSMEQIIQKELLVRPKDTKMRVRLMRTFLEKKRIDEAFNYAYKVELELPAQCQSSDWYDVVWTVLHKREQSKEIYKDWPYWHLLLITLDRLTQLSLQSEASSSLTESVGQLFKLDQYIYKFSQHSDELASSGSRELHQCCLDHYAGQLLLHAATLIFKRELLGSKNKWTSTVRAVLPLLLLGYQKRFDTDEKASHWQRHCNHEQHQLLKLWRHQSAFRCAQLGRTLYGCVQYKFTDRVDDNTSWQSKPMQGLWLTMNELLSAARQQCVDQQWRNHLYQQLYTHSDHKLKEQTSQLVRDQRLQQPLYDCPSVADIEAHEQDALLLAPPTLEHHVYLALGTDNLAEAPRVRFLKDMRHDCYQGLGYCGSDSISQLDVEVFLYAVVLQVKRKLLVQRDNYSSYHVGNANATARPYMLPFANLMARNDLITQEQTNWWTMIQHLQDNFYLTDNGNGVEQREHLQLGIEAVRGVKGPHAEIVMVFELAKLLSSREDADNLELRIETLYRLGLKMMRSHSQQQLEPFYRFFKYANPLETSIWEKTQELADEAIRFLSARLFKLGKYEDFLAEARGVESPIAAYLQSEAYRNLADSNRASRVARHHFQERRIELLRQTKTLLARDPGHPLLSIVQRELKSFHADEHENQDHNNSSTYEDAEDDFYTAAANSLNRSRRQATEQPPPVPASVVTLPSELEETVKQMSKQLCGLKEDVGGGMDSMRQEIKSLHEKFSVIEELLKKCKISSGGSASGDIPARDVDAALGLEEFLNMEEALQTNYLNGVASGAGQDRFFPPPANAPHPNAVYGNPMFNQNPMYNYYANQTQFMRPPTAPGSMPPSFFGPRGPTNYPVPPNMFANPAGAPFMDGLNYGMPAQPPSLVMPQVSQAQAPIMSLSQASAQPNLQIAPAGGNFFNNTPFMPSPIQGPQSTQQPPVQAALLPSKTTSVQSITSVSTAAVTTTNAAPLSFAPLNATPLAAAGAAPAPAVPGPAAAAVPAAAPPVVFNRALNNQPVEKEPPANVVITSSDPLPKPAVSSAQPTLSVTIPAQHIKPSLVQPLEPPTTTGLDFNLNLGNSNKTSSTSSNVFGVFTPTSTFSFKSQVAQAAAEKEKEREAEATATQSESISSEHNQSASHDASAELDYDPRPDFQGIIPLPDEVEVHTGEEDEEVKVCVRAKLFRHAENEWKERGIGMIKILKNTSTGIARILMRRDQTHKICANHAIKPGMHLTQPTQDKEGKSFLWVANDYADEKLQVEKFLVRFKTPEVANEFKVAFEKQVAPAETTKVVQKPLSFGAAKSNVDSFLTSTPAAVSAPVKQTELIKSNSKDAAASAEPAVPKSLFGNLTTKSSEPAAASPFANFSFSSPANNSKANATNFSFNVTALPDTSANNSAAFTTAFNFGGNLTDNKANSTLQKQTQTPAQTQTQDANKSNTETDAEEEYVSTAQFVPVIPLPELVNVVTGEEDELVLFEHRAKLLRFDKESNEWKERGLGNMKVLQLKTDPSQVRLLMRREQVLKLCCNQRLLPDTKFSYIKNSQNSLTWAAQDFADEELVPALLCVRFKTAETCKTFYDAVLKAQANMSAAKPNAPQLAVKAGEEKQEKKKDKEDKSKATQGFGEAFKPKAGSWSCTGCYTSNDAKQLYCLCCDAPKDDTVPAKPQKLESSGVLNLSSSAAKFSFGFAPSTTSTGGFSFGAKPAVANPPAAPASKPVSVLPTPKAAPSAAGNQSGFGDVFKPKAGSWSCRDCYTNNEAAQLHCVACQAPKDDTVPKKDANKLDTSGGITFPATTSKFTFGFGTSIVSPAAPAASSAAPAVTPVVATSSAPPAANTASPFAVASADSGGKDKGSLFGSASFNFKPAAAATTAATLTPANSSFSSSSLVSNTFSFSMPKAQQQQQPKSPAATGGGGDDDESHVEEEENNAYFAPVIPLPDKIDVKTGEENEDLLYVHRAKLYRMCEDGEWKERGLGDVKILRHKETKNLRVVMRREKVLKICLNHVLNSDVIYKPKDEKSWLFVVHDFSEGESVLERFALRFKNAEIAQVFLKAIGSALDGTAEPIEESLDQSAQASETSIEQAVADSTATDEVRKLADKLFLSYEFLTTTTNCEGCRGCEPDNFEYGQPAKIESSVKPLPLTQPALELPAPKPQDPLQPSQETTQSPANRTVLKASSLAPTSKTGSTFGSFSFGSTISANSTATVTDSKVTEDSGAARTGGFLFGKSDGAVFGQSLFGNNSATKLPQQSIFGGSFGTTEIKFGASEGSIFGGGLVKPQTGTQEETTKSIFSSSVLSGNTFGSNVSSGSVFGSAAGKSPTHVIGSESKDSVVSFADLNKTEVTAKDNKENIVETRVGTPGSNNSESIGNKFMDFSAKAGDDFASLAAKGVGNPIGFQKSESGGFFGLTHQDDFKNFKSPVAASQTGASDADGSNADGATDDNYDPHYEPIIALPNEIVVSTGEENETKLFGERSTLYRFDADTKEWKERGVGELKVLKHNIHHTYRMVMRREQILKLVLNMNIGADFSMEYMNEQKKSFIWANLNFAETTDGVVERLACRFKNIDLANKFFETVNKCKEDAKEVESQQSVHKLDVIAETVVTKAH